MTHRDWKTWRFDQIAVNVNDRIDDPSAADVEYYVGLEHLDPDSLKIRRWGAPSDVEATKLLFRKGDIIFGRRRAYQRKLAVADFNGICSAHAMVLRAKPDVALPEFLPFFMQSDLFMNRAVEISVGSLSPTINWKTLAAQEFALPPLEEQRRIAEVLTLSRLVNESLELCKKHASALFSARRDQLLHEIGQSNSCRVTDLGQLLTESPHSGCSASEVSSPTGHFVLGLAALTQDGYRPGDYKCVHPTEAMLSARLNTGDLLISRSNTIERVGLVGIFNESREDISFPDTMMRLPANSKLVLSRFLEILLQSTRSRRFIMSIAAGTSASMKKINRANLLRMPVSLPPIQVQEATLELLDGIDDGRNQLVERSARSRELHNRLLNEIVTRKD